jgi:hypothetical protein
MDISGNKSDARKIKPVKFLITMMTSCQNLLFYISTGSFDRKINDFYGFSGDFTGHTECIHEEGGKYAIFEKIEHYEQKKTDLDMVVGSTYRVVFCQCFKDKNLKFVSEYCDWCRCIKCGGSKNNKNYDSSSNNNNYGNNNKTNEEMLNEFIDQFQFKIYEINPDLVILLLLIIVLIITHYYLKNDNYYLYASALVSGTFLLRNYVIPIAERLSKTIL